MIEDVLTDILKKLPTSDNSESNDSKSIQASASHPWPVSSARDPEGQPSYLRGILSKSCVSVVDVDTTAAAPEAKDAPEDQPLSNVPESHDTRRDV